MKELTTKQKYQKAYYQRPEVKQKALERSRKYRLEHPEKVKKARDKNKSQIETKMLYDAKSRANKVGLDFNITKTDIQIPEFCPVLGVKLEIGSYDDKPTLDRIHNDKGYVKGNIAVISWRANRLKSNLTLEELEKLVTYIKSFTTSD